MTGLYQHPGGGIYGDKADSMKRLIENYNNLPQVFKNRLIFENYEKSFSIEDCLFISKNTGIPVVLDSFYLNATRKYPERKIRRYTLLH